ncbi:hypothetical protein [Pseudoramibacter porci]|uniref:DUF1292 domain-containing protein n=1 Tax=Pseudoramibacter porci TaxID=2606631 RepID=A0A7X2NH41_9FIRM|nr:hypothetical protein [Pseudoramibacter porci]MSS20316.1 hypothetical protein [Pseudoramibacter porci]
MTKHKNGFNMEQTQNLEFNRLIEKDDGSYMVFIDENHQEHVMKMTDYDDNGERHFILEPDD